LSALRRSFSAQRSFGLWVGAILAAFGAWWVYREKYPAVRPAFLAIGALLVLLGALWPRALVLPYRAWMALAEQLSKVVTALVLAFVYFLVVTPIGVFKRLRGWDPLERRAAPAAGASFWRPYPERQHDPKHFDRMF
jgi:hypothetical protein